MNYVFININYLLKNKVIWCVKLRKFVNVKNISGVNVVFANKAWLSPFKRSNYPVNTTTSFRKRYLNLTHLGVIIKRKKKDQIFYFLYFASGLGWIYFWALDGLLCRYKLTNINLCILKGPIQFYTLKRYRWQTNVLNLFLLFFTA